MRNKTLRLVALALCLCVALIACEPGESQPAEDTSPGAKGRYLEHATEIPDNIWFLSIAGQVESDVFYMMGHDRDGSWQVWHSADSGEHWEELSPGWLETFNAESFNYSSVRGAFTPEGEAYLAYSVYDEEEQSHTHYLVFAGRNGMEALGIELEEAVSWLGRTGDGELLMNIGGDIELWDATVTQRLRTIPVGEDRRFAVTGRTLVVCDYYDVDSFQLYDLDTGEAAGTLPVTGEVGGFVGQDDGSGVFYHNDEGLFRVSMDGAITEQLIDGRLSTFGIPYIQIAYVYPLRDEDFLMLYVEDEVYRGKKLVFDSTVPTTPEQQLSIYSLRDNQSVRSAGTLFAQDYPEFLVDFQVGLPDSGGVSADDAIRVLATQMIAGSGPDLLLLDGLPMEGYVQKGALLDIGDLEALANGELLPGIPASFTDEKGELYAVPTRFSLPYIQGGFLSADNLSALMRWLEEQEYPLTASIDDPLDFFIDWCYPRWFDIDGSLNHEAFQEDLSAIKTFADIQERMEAPEHLPRNADWLNQAFWWSTEQTALMLGNVYDIEEFSEIWSALDFREGQGGPLDEGGVLYLPQGILGINAGSEYPAEAKAFINFALGEEMQARSLYDGLPVRRQTWEKKLNRREPEAAIGRLRDQNHREEGIVEFQWRWFTEAEMQDVLKLAESVSVPSLPQERLRQMVREGTADYLSGAKSLEAAVEETARKVRQHLDENR